MNMEHGGRIFAAARILGRPWREIIDFSANVNPFGQPQGLKSHIFAQFDATIHYPEERAQSLTEALATTYALDQSHFLPGAGSSIHILILARLLKDCPTVIVGPAFSEYEAALRAAGANFSYVNAKAPELFMVSHNTLKSILNKRPKVIFLANPANPTGRLLMSSIMDELVAEAESRKIYLVVDEAFLDFTSGSSLVPRVKTHKYLIVLRSLTKIMAVPGLRLAYLAASPEIVKTLWPHLGPWPLSSPALAAGLYWLAKPFNQQAFSSKVSQLRDHLTETLSPYGKLVPSDANFTLFKYDTKRTDDLTQFLFNNGLLIRDARNFESLSKGWLRLAVRPKKEIMALQELLRKFHA
jgi:threonine-phosphate decarboxylase